MSDLRLPMKELTFDQLVELGRAAIPPAAPGWTDHNIHDPGIMLMELVAWIAEAQIYSLSRLRRDERFAYARLLDTDPRGPRPATGLIWPHASDERPSQQPPWAEGTVIPAGRAVSANRPHAPTFFTAHEVALTTARIVRLESRFADGSRRDWTAANALDGATFVPFGPSPVRGDRLVIVFELSPADLANFRGPIALGFEIVGEQRAPVDTQCLDPTPSGSAQGQRRSRLVATLYSGDASRQLRILDDSTDTLVKSGVLLLDIPAGVVRETTFEIAIESATGGLVRSPRIQRIAPNVLNVVQRQSISAEPGTLQAGQPDQTYELQRSGLIFPFTDDGFALAVSERGAFQPWTRTMDLSQSGPGDRHFEIDEAAGRVRFGNGVNGFIPATNETLSVSYTVCEGTRGNLPRNSRWTVNGIVGEFGANSDVMAGGCDAIGLRELGAVVRRRSRRPRPLVTSRDLEEAAQQFADIGVNRASEIARPSRCKQVRGTRTLVVMSRHDTGGERIDAEAREFLAEVRRRLAPRLPIGQRLEVVGPKFVPLRVSARLLAARKANPATVRSAAVAALEERLRVTATGDNNEWPFGRNVTAASVKGWLRSVDGVIAVTQLELLAGDEMRAVEQLDLSGRELPSLRVEPSDVTVQRQSLGSAS